MPHLIGAKVCDVTTLKNTFCFFVAYILELLIEDRNWTEIEDIKANYTSKRQKAVSVVL